MTPIEMGATLQVSLPDEDAGYEEAQAKLRDWLSAAWTSARASYTTGRDFEFSIRSVLQDLILATNRTRIDEHNRSHERPFVDIDFSKHSAAFHAAAWELARRGVVSPAGTYRNGAFAFPGDEFRLTPYGRTWLENLPAHDVIPTEHSRFSQRLASHAARFGLVYESRSQEALGCYRGQLYLACCVMCGAAAEAILLRLAIVRSGDEDKILKDYRRPTGATSILNLLKAGQNSFLRDELDTCITLLKYWRDDAAHAAAVGFDEETAFFSLLLLLRLAHLVDTRWDDLTAPISAS